MKKIIFTLFIILLAFSCLNSKSRKKNTETVEITGLVESGMDNRICIITDWEMKSRVSYYVQDKYQKKLKEFIGKIITVKGYVISETSMWNKEFHIEKIIKVIEK